MPSMARQWGSSDTPPEAASRSRAVRRAATAARAAGTGPLPARLRSPRVPCGTTRGRGADRARLSGAPGRLAGRPQRLSARHSGPSRAGSGMGAERLGRRGGRSRSRRCGPRGAGAGRWPDRRGARRDLGPARGSHAPGRWPPRRPRSSRRSSSRCSGSSAAGAPRVTVAAVPPPHRPWPTGAATAGAERRSAGEHRGIGVNAPDGILRREPASARGAPDPLGRSARPRRPRAPGAPAGRRCTSRLTLSTTTSLQYVERAPRGPGSARAPALPAFAMHSRLSTCLGWNTSYAAELGLNGRARSWSTSASTLARLGCGDASQDRFQHPRSNSASPPNLACNGARRARVGYRAGSKSGWAAPDSVVRAARLGAQGGEEVPVEEAEEDQGGVRDGLVRELGATHGRGQPLDGFEGDGRGLRAGRQQREDRGWRTAISRYPRAMSRAMSIQSPLPVG